MDTYKFLFWVNLVVIIIESATIYLYSQSLGWLLFMLMAVVIEIFTVILRKQTKDKYNKKNDLL